MATKAFTATGTKIKIGTLTAGTPIAITAVTKATKAVVTNTGTNNLAKGDKVTFGTILGMPEISNQSAIVTAVGSATSFTVDIDSSAFAAAGTTGTATAVVYVTHCEVTSFSGLDGEAADQDATTVCSDAKEFVTGLADAGNFSLNHNVVLDDIAQMELIKSQADGYQRAFSVTFRNGTGFAFGGNVKSYTIDGSADAIVTGSSNIKISGRVTYF